LPPCKAAFRLYGFRFHFSAPIVSAMLTMKVITNVTEGARAETAHSRPPVRMATG